MKRYAPLVLLAAAVALSGCAGAQPRGGEPAAPDAANTRQAPRDGAEAVWRALQEQAMAGCVEEVVAIVDVSRQQARAGCAARLLDGEPALPPLDSKPAAVPGSLVCGLERIGIQYVRCDDLSGAGAPAPRWVPEQD